MIILAALLTALVVLVASDADPQEPRDR